MSLGRLTFLAVLTVLVLGTTAATAGGAATRPAVSDDETAARHSIVDYYAAWAAHDVARYRSLCTDDYLVVEDGRIIDLEQDLEWLRLHAWHDGKSQVDFRKVLIQGDQAYAIYFLDFEFTKAQSVEHRRFLETAVLRRTAKGWLVSLVHSTKLKVTPIQDVASATGDEFQTAMAWAFPLNPPLEPRAPKPDLHRPLHVPGSSRTYTLADYDDMFGAPDWFPQDHPPMPRIVARGRKPAWACAYCHLPNGQGRPENASLAGLPVEYIVEQVRAFRNGQRNKGRQEVKEYMPIEARNVTDADLHLAAEYFSKLKFRPWTRVVETAMVPKTHVAHWMLVPDTSGAREPIGDRIIETTTDIGRTELRDTRFGFVAYVPPGSIERGEVIASKGVGAALPCASCHGADLRGIGDIPPLAGRSPTYIVRQLILFRTGGRSNAAAAPMRVEASHLTLKAMIDIAAYTASRHP